EGDDVGLTGEPGDVVLAARQLRVEADQLLFEAVLFIIEPGNRRCRLRNRKGERLSLAGEPLQRLPIRFETFAELLDLTACRENSARLGFGTAGHQVRSAEDITIERRDDCRRLAR